MTDQVDFLVISLGSYPNRLTSLLWIILLRLWEDTEKRKKKGWTSGILSLDLTGLEKLLMKRYLYSKLEDGSRYILGTF